MEVLWGEKLPGVVAWSRECERGCGGSFLGWGGGNVSRKNLALYFIVVSLSLLVSLPLDIATV